MCAAPKDAKDAWIGLVYPTNAAHRYCWRKARRASISVASVAAEQTAAQPRSPLGSQVFAVIQLTCQGEERKKEDVQSTRSRCRTRTRRGNRPRNRTRFGTGDGMGV